MRFIYDIKTLLEKIILKNYWFHKWYNNIIEHI